MKIASNMIFSGTDDSRGWKEDADSESKSLRLNISALTALGGLEMLVLTFFNATRQELLRGSGVCSAWRAFSKELHVLGANACHPMGKVSVAAIAGSGARPDASAGKGAGDPDYYDLSKA